MISLITNLLPWQEQAVSKLIHLKVGALYMDMSTGKTRTALELLCRRIDVGKVTKAIWLCPINTAGKLPSLISEHAINWESYIKIVGIETLSSSFKMNLELRKLVDTEEVFLIVDESTLVKNPFALRTKNITSIAEKCQYKLILSGTPITKCEADLFSQWYILDWRVLGYRSFWSFSANHLEYDANQPGRIRRVLNLDYLAEKIAPYTFEIKREDCFSLPPKSYSSMLFNLTDEQEENYALASEILLTQVNEMRPETIYRLFGALQVITSGFMLRFLDEKHYEKYIGFPNPLDNPRMRALINVLDGIPKDQKVLINCKYTQEINGILKVLNERRAGSAVPFNGEISTKKRAANLTAFQNEATYLIANKSCSQYGLNLQFCNNIIFYNNDWDYATRLQAEDRLHRYGQKNKVNIIDIICQSTIDVTIQQCLIKKENILDRFKGEIKDKSKLDATLRNMICGILKSED